MKNILFKRKYVITLVFLLGFFVFVNTCRAEGVMDWTTNLLGDFSKNMIDGVVGSLARLMGAVLGWITGKIVAMIIGFAQYNDFVNNAQVKEGWTVVRDICNMFFILILLFIAFAVILRLESYSIKKSLPKLLMMAVLINFSRTICGILIDLSQIVMLTFTGPITQGQGNFYNVLQIDKFLTAVASANYQTLTLTNTVIYYVIAVLFMLISCVVLIAILIAFVMRIVMFWIYIVLSPLAFLLSSFPGGQKYAGQYWGEFTKYLLNGPVLAFFLWLSLYTLGNMDTTQIGSAFPDGGIAILQGPNFARFVMAIGMLVGGLTISAQIGGIGSKWGSDMVSNIKNKGIGVAKRVSGYDAVADRAKAYMAMRRTARAEKINESTARIAGYMGKPKKFISDNVNKGLTKVTDIAETGWAKLRGANTVRNLNSDIDSLQKHNKLNSENNLKSRDEINKHRDNITNIENKARLLEKFRKTGKLDNGESLLLGDDSYEYNQGKWKSRNDGTVYTDDEFKGNTDINHLLHDGDAMLTRRKQSYENAIKSREDIMAKRDKETAQNDDLIADKLKQRESAEKHRKGIETAGRYGLAALGGSVSALLSGSGLGFVAGAFATDSMADDLKNAGKKDMKMAASYEDNKISGERPALKNKDTDEVREIMNNTDTALFKRMAAALELISRKETSTQEVNDMRNRFFSGSSEKVKNNFEGEVLRNVVGASKLFDFDPHNVEDQDKRNKIKEKFSLGSLTLDNLDSAALMKCGEMIATGLKNATFKRQYDGLSDAKKVVVENSLRGANTYEAREKLAKVTSIDEAFGNNDSEKKRYTKGLSMKDIQEIISEGTERKRVALRNAITRDGELEAQALAEGVYDQLRDSNIKNLNAIRRALGVTLPTP